MKPVPTLRSRRGFTLLELLVVVSVGGVLTSLTFMTFSRVHGQLGTSSAVSNVLSLHHQARALAVERGALVNFVVDEALGEVRVEGGGQVLNRLDVTGEFEVTLDAGGGLTQCFTPRGVADLTCTTFDRPATITLTRGGRVGTIELLPLGQARER